MGRPSKLFSYKYGNIMSFSSISNFAHSFSLSLCCWHSKWFGLYMIGCVVCTFGYDASWGSHMCLQLLCVTHILVVILSVGTVGYHKHTWLWLAENHLWDKQKICHMQVTTRNQTHNLMLTRQVPYPLSHLLVPSDEFFTTLNLKNQRYIAWAFITN